MFLRSLSSSLAWSATPFSSGSSSGPHNCPFSFRSLCFPHCFTSFFQIIQFETIPILLFFLNKKSEFDLNWYVADYWVINRHSRNKVSKGMPLFATKRLLASNVSLLIHYRSVDLHTLADWLEPKVL
jgi:hypothetical protein